MEETQETQAAPVNQLRMPLSFPELLSMTRGPIDGTTRVEMLGLPRDTNLNDRLALVVCGPGAGRLMNFLAGALETLRQPPPAPAADPSEGPTQSDGPQPGV